jgi:hypothetical protein
VKFIPVAAVTSITKSSIVIKAIMRYEKKYSLFSLGPLHGEHHHEWIGAKINQYVVEANVHTLRHQLWYITNGKCRSPRHGVLGPRNPLGKKDIESVRGGIGNPCRANGQEIDPHPLLAHGKAKRIIKPLNVLKELSVIK